MPYVGGNQGQFCIKGNAPDDKCPSTLPFWYSYF